MQLAYKANKNAGFLRLLHFLRIHRKLSEPKIEKSCKNLQFPLGIIALVLLAKHLVPRIFQSPSGFILQLAENSPQQNDFKLSIPSGFYYIICRSANTAEGNLFNPLWVLLAKIAMKAIMDGENFQSPLGFISTLGRYTTGISEVLFNPLWVLLQSSTPEIPMSPARIFNPLWVLLLWRSLKAFGKRNIFSIPSGFYLTMHTISTMKTEKFSIPSGFY